MYKIGGIVLDTIIGVVAYELVCMAFNKIKNVVQKVEAEPVVVDNDGIQNVEFYEPVLKYAEAV